MGRFGWPDVIGIQEQALDAPPRSSSSAALPNAAAQRQHEFVAGRACASDALHQAGCPGPYTLARLPDGLPAWPPGWTGSISHSRRRVIAAAGSTVHAQGLGIDIEEWMPRDRAAWVAPHVATAAELDLVAGLHAPCAATLAFCAKEALYKALYPQTRRITEFSAARIIAASRHGLRLVLTEDWSSAFPAGRVFEVAIETAPAHACAGLWLQPA